MKRYLGYLLIINIVISAWLFFYRNALPSPNAIDPLLKNDPIQTLTSKQPFFVDTKDFRFYIEPLYEYHLYGLVVSKYNARKKFMARVDKDLNFTDICVLWGKNAFSGVYNKVSFWSGEFTCYANSKTPVYFYGEKYKQVNLDNIPSDVAIFNIDLFSNNHLVTENKQLGKLLRNVNIGDQISISGYLVNYGASADNIYRRTSTVRTDTGNGACETIYVTSFATLHKNGYRQASNLSLITLFSLFIIWLAYQLTPFTTKNNPELDD